MRNTLIASAAIVALALSVRADEKPTDAYRKAMRDNGDAMQTIRAAAKDIEESGSGVQDYTPFDGATAIMKGTFATTLDFWQGRKADDAIAFAQDGAKQATALAVAAKDRDYRVVLASLTALGETCTGCHMAHRARLADGSYAIK
jgi:hypothetical protein